MSRDVPSLVKGVLSGNRLALARLLTLVENDNHGGRKALDALFPYTGSAHLIGVTGAPGTGKSSLVNQLAHHYRHPGDGFTARKVGIVAVDPSSPFTGGAILGDRVRMRDLAGDPGVFIRSMASRGSLGGLAAATDSLVQVLDAAGYEIILIETVGAGQAEVDVARLAHTTIVVEAPGLGDDIQAIKAGILEIADVLVINKADRPGVENTERALRGMLQLGTLKHRRLQKGSIYHLSGSGIEEIPAAQIDWETPIRRTVATEGEGIGELVRSIEEHKTYLLETDKWKQRDQIRLQAEFQTLLESSLVTQWRSQIPGDEYQKVMNDLHARKLSPWQAVRSLVPSIE